MDSALAARLNPGHRQRLEWFEERQGQISPFPPPLNDGMLLAAKAKGIYKPKELAYAVSIRINLGSPYAGWAMRYPACVASIAHQPANARRTPG
jgi:hypothetical protein